MKKSLLSLSIAVAIIGMGTASVAVAHTPGFDTTAGYKSPLVTNPLAPPKGQTSAPPISAKVPNSAPKIPWVFLSVPDKIRMLV